MDEEKDLIEKLNRCSVELSAMQDTFISLAKAESGCKPVRRCVSSANEAIEGIKILNNALYEIVTILTFGSLDAAEEGEEAEK